MASAIKLSDLLKNLNPKLRKLTVSDVKKLKKSVDQYKAKRTAGQPQLCCCCSSGN